MSDHIVPTRVYYTIFAALMVLTALTVWVAFFDLGILNDVAALGIAAIKATLVVLFFMHVRYSSRLISLIVGTGFAWLAVLLVLTMADYFSRGWLPFPGK
jgi:cytochrome c oxidase subunit 4